MEEERKDESPASWRLGLRKTGSYGALAEITAAKEAQREKDTTGVMRSASSPRLSSSLDNKDKEKVDSLILSLNITNSCKGGFMKQLSTVFEKEEIIELCKSSYETHSHQPCSSSAYRKRTKGPGWPMWPPPFPGDWPVLQT